MRRVLAAADAMMRSLHRGLMTVTRTLSREHDRSDLEDPRRR